MIDAAAKLRFYTVEQISESMHLTPEGYLLILNTPIARTGMQMYGAEETPITPGPDGLVRVERKWEDVFRPETIASCQGKPVVNDHPFGAVDPTNWNDLAIGVVLNVRRGSDSQYDLLLGDVQITNAQAIADIQAGKREWSCGYDAEYIETAPGYGYQTNIVVNHLALVAKGRCGPVCAIRDCEPEPSRSNFMKKWLDYLKAAIASKDQKKVDELLAAVPTNDDSGIHLHVGGPIEGSEGGKPSHDRKWNDEALEKKFGEHEAAIKDCKDTMTTNHKAVMDSLEDLKKGMGNKDAESKEDKEVEGQLEEEAPAGTGDKARAAKDSVYLADSFQATVANAEIIAPGLHIPTFDAARDPKQTFRDICGLRRKALQLGNNDPATYSVIENLRGGRALTGDALEKMSCGEVRTLFHTVATIKREKNNARPLAVAATAAAGTTDGPKKIRTLADINKQNRDFWK